MTALVVVYDVREVKCFIPCLGLFELFTGNKLVVLTVGQVDGVRTYLWEFLGDIGREIGTAADEARGLDQAGHGETAGHRDPLTEAEEEYAVPVERGSLPHTLDEAGEIVVDVVDAVFFFVGTEPVKADFFNAGVEVELVGSLGHDNEDVPVLQGLEVAYEAFCVLPPTVNGKEERRGFLVGLVGFLGGVVHGEVDGEWVYFRVCGFTMGHGLPLFRSLVYPSDVVGFIPIGAFGSFVMDFNTWNSDELFFSYAEHRIAYHRGGAGEPLLLVHGFPTSSWDWHGVWRELTARYDVLAVDMIGFGRSDKPQGYGYSLFDQADLVTAFLAAKGISAVHILAHDYGDTVVQELLARQNEAKLPFKIVSVALLNGGIIPGKHRPRLMQTLLISPVGSFVGRMMSYKRFASSFSDIFGTFTRPTEQELREYWEHIRYNQGPRVVHLLIRYMKERKENYDRWVGVLGRPGVPLVLIFGGVDPISGIHMSDAFRLENPGAPVYVLKGIGHYPQLEAANQVLEAYGEFRDGLMGAGE